MQILDVRCKDGRAFPEGRDAMIQAISSSVIRSGLEWGVASSSREMSEWQSGDMVESW